MRNYKPCTCKGTRKEKMKNWYVLMKNYNLSVRQGDEEDESPKHISDYTTVMCKKCWMCIRSKSNYIKYLPVMKRAIKLKDGEA